MGDVYQEYLLKRKMTAVGVAVRVFFVSLCFSLACLGIMYIQPMFLMLAVAFGYLTKYVFQQTDVEYEYQYLNGECQFDKICGKTRRKTLGKMEMAKIEVIAPEGSQELAQYEKQNHIIKDYSSLEKSEDRYIAFERRDSGLIKIIFEPNETIIKEMQKLAPRKVRIKGEEKRAY